MYERFAQAYEKNEILLKAIIPGEVNGFRILRKQEEIDFYQHGALRMIKAGENTDCVIFLDNGARLLGGLFNKAFSAAYPDKPKPDLKFLNLGREKIRLLSRIDGFYGASLKGFREELNYFIKDEDALVGIYGQIAVEDLKRILKMGKRKERNKILIVDEVMDTGKTGALAVHILKIIYPEAETSYFNLTTGKSAPNLVKFPSLISFWGLDNSFLSEKGDYFGRRYIKAIDKDGKIIRAKKDEEIPLWTRHTFDRKVMELHAKKQDLAKIAQAVGGIAISTPTARP